MKKERKWLKLLEKSEYLPESIVILGSIVIAIWYVLLVFIGHPLV
jgi:hypothetical protein